MCLFVCQFFRRVLLRVCVHTSVPVREYACVYVHVSEHVSECITFCCPGRLGGSKKHKLSAQEFVGRGGHMRREQRAA